ncbi:MAG: hypothetical protein AB7I30_11530, partial [Isosphaeraceae bacterium]
MKRGAVLLSQTPRRLARVPAPGGKVALVHSSYLPEDTLGRVHSFLSHVMIYSEATATTGKAASAWGSSDWLVDGFEKGESQTLSAPASEVPDGGLVGDATLAAFLGARAADEDQSLVRVTLPTRVETDPGARRRWVRGALRAFLLSLDPNASRTRVYLVAEPGVVALLVYAIQRLLPARLVGEFAFSTYEPPHTTLRENKVARVIGSYARGGLDRSDVDALRRRGHVLDTIADSYGPGLELDETWPLEPLLQLVAEGDWGAVDEIRALWASDAAVVPGASEAALAEALMVRPLALALREGTVNAEGLLRLRQSRIGQSLLRANDARGSAWRALRPVWSSPAVVSGFPDLIVEHRSELLGELNQRASAEPIAAWFPQWSALRPLLSDELRNEAMSGLLKAVGKSPGAATLSTADRLGLVEEWSRNARKGAAFPQEAQWLLRQGPGSNVRELVLAPALRPAMAGAAACLAIAEGNAGRELLDALPDDRFAAFLSALERFPGRAAVIERLFPRGDPPSTRLVERALGSGDDPLPPSVERFLLEVGCDGPNWLPFWRESDRLSALLGRLAPNSPLGGRLMQSLIGALGPQVLSNPDGADEIAKLAGLADQFPESLGTDGLERLEAWALLHRVVTNPGRAKATPSAIAAACRTVGHPPEALATRVFRARVKKGRDRASVVAASDAAASFLLRALGTEDAALEAALGLADGVSSPEYVRGLMFKAIVSDEHWNRLRDLHQDRLQGSNVQRRSGTKGEAAFRGSGPVRRDGVVTLGKFQVPRRSFEIAVSFLLGAGMAANFSAILWMFSHPVAPAVNPLTEKVASLEAQLKDAGVAVANFEKKVDTLEEVVANRDVEIDGLKRLQKPKEPATEPVRQNVSERVIGSIANASPIRGEADARAVARALAWVARELPEGEARTFAGKLKRLTLRLNPQALPDAARVPCDGFRFLTAEDPSTGVLALLGGDSKPMPMIRFSGESSDGRGLNVVEVPVANRILAVSGSGKTLLAKDSAVGGHSDAMTLKADRIASHDFSKPFEDKLAANFPIQQSDSRFALTDLVASGEVGYASSTLQGDDKGKGLTQWVARKDQTPLLTHAESLYQKLPQGVNLKDGKPPRLSFDASGDHLVLGTRGDASLFLFNARDPASAPRPITPGQPIRDWAHPPKGSRLLIATDQTVWAVDLASPPPPQESPPPVVLKGLEPAMGPLRALAVSPHGTALAVGDQSGTVCLASWDSESGTLTPLLRLGHEGPVLQLGFSSDGRLLAVLTESDSTHPGEGVVQVWRADDWNAPDPPPPANSPPAPAESGAATQRNPEDVPFQSHGAMEDLAS